VSIFLFLDFLVKPHSLSCQFPHSWVKYIFYTMSVFLCIWDSFSNSLGIIFWQTGNLQIYRRGMWITTRSRVIQSRVGWPWQEDAEMISSLKVSHLSTLADGCQWLPWKHYKSDFSRQGKDLNFYLKFHFQSQNLSVGWICSVTHRFITSYLALHICSLLFLTLSPSSSSCTLRLSHIFISLFIPRPSSPGLLQQLPN
jgi:hypothetical protein